MRAGRRGAAGAARRRPPRAGADFAPPLRELRVYGSLVPEEDNPTLGLGQRYRHTGHFVIMSKTGSTDPVRGDAGQPPPEPRSLFALVAVFLIIADLWLLAAVLTELLSTGLFAFDGRAYMLVYIVLVVALLGLAVLVRKVMNVAGKGEAWIKTPAVLQRGYLQLRRWTQGASYRLFFCSLGIGIACALAGRVSMDIVALTYQGARFEFLGTLAMVISAFGLGISLLLGASLIAGLLTKEPSGT